MTRDSIVPYYVKLIWSEPSPERIARFNESIIKRWSNSGLLYIKNKAWKIVNNS